MEFRLEDASPLFRRLVPMLDRVATGVVTGTRRSGAQMNDINLALAKVLISRMGHG